MMPVFGKASLVPNIHGTAFLLLCISSVLIAAAGYIINDYFDLNIDQVNKPEKLVVEKIIRRRWTIAWHLLLSLAGIGIGFYLDVTTRIRFLGVANFLCALLLFLYSISLKKKILLGNILISLLTAWVILVVTWCENSYLINKKIDLGGNKILRITFLYAGFAFIISLIREVIKDMEDIEGDRKYGCRTIPIVWGMNAAKIFASVWMVVLIAVLIIVQMYALHLGWWLSVAYCLLVIVAPLLWIFRQLFSAHTPPDFHTLSSFIKLVMFTGILSMVFFRYYA